MPVFYSPLPNDTDTVTRPAVIGVFKELLAIYGLPTQRRIVYTDLVKQPANTTPTDVTSVKNALQHRLARLPSEPCYLLEVDERLTPENINHSGIAARNRPALLYDAETGYTVKLSTLFTEYEVRVTLQSDSLVELNNFRNTVAVRQGMGQSHNQHTILYNSFLPSKAAYIFRLITAAGKDSPPTLNEVLERLGNIMSPAGSLLGSSTGKISDIGFTFNVPDILGNIADNQLPDPVERDQESGTYAISFVYQFAFEKPSGVFVHFPVIVNNELLPLNVVDRPRQIDTQYPFMFGHTAEITLQYLEQRRMAFRGLKLDLLTRYPDYDKIELKSRLPAYVPLMQLLCQLDDTLILCSLKELGDIEVDSDILAFLLESEAPYLHTPYQSIFHVGLSLNESLGREALVRTQTTGEVTLYYPTDKKKRHRLHVSICISPELLSPEALRRLLNYANKSVLDKIIGILNHLYMVMPGAQFKNRRMGFTEEDFRNHGAYGWQQGPLKRVVGAHPLAPHSTDPRGKTSILRTPITTLISSIINRRSKDNGTG